jgi:hypothetical protein
MPALEGPFITSLTSGLILLLLVLEKVLALLDPINETLGETEDILFTSNQLNYIISIPHFWVTFKHVKKVVSFSSFWFNKSFQFGKKCFVVLRSNLIGCDYLKCAKINLHSYRE